MYAWEHLTPEPQCVPQDPQAAESNWRNLSQALFKSFLPLPLPLQDFLSKPSLNPSEIELGSEVTLKDFPYVNYSQPGLEQRWAPTICRWGRLTQLCKSPSSGRCRFGVN